MTMRPWQANLIGVGVAGLVIGGGLLLGAPEAVADGPTHPQVLGASDQSGDGAGEIPLGDSLRMWGRPARLSVFWTSDPVDRIVQTYSDAWAAIGMVPHVDKIDKVTAVTVLQTKPGPGYGLMRSVTIIDKGNERLVIPGLADYGVAPDLSAKNAPVPIPPSACAYLGQSVNDTGSVSFNGTFEADLTADQVIQFYQRELGKQGYTISTPAKKLQGGESIEFVRGPEWVSVVAKADLTRSDATMAKKAGLPDKPSSQVMIMHVRTLAAKPEWKP